MDWRGAGRTRRAGKEDWMKYGVSYYPEHKTADELEADLVLLKQSGINTVRMGEFAWCRMEPHEGQFDFEWLAKVVEELGRAGIGTVLCTPTACPPSWLIKKHPDILYMDNRRIRRPFGGRRHYCYNNGTYRKYSVRIAEKLAGFFEGNPYITGVQIDNEPAQEGTGRCCCPVCEEKFHDYLRREYGNIEEFNVRSGSIFWSQEYGDFDEIPLPVNTIETGAQNLIEAYYENPTVRLAFERFCSDSQKEYQDLQAAALRRHLHVPITTNGTGLATNSIDYYDSSENLDRYAFDFYPGLRDAKVDSFPYAFARGIKNGAPFWVLEFMSGGGHKLGGTGRVQPNPGALKQAVVQSMAHGGEMMLHFQFRTYPFGAEQLNYAIVDMDGIPRRRYREMQETAALLKKLEPLEKTVFPGEAAVCFDYDCHWALRIKPVNDPAFHYVEYCGKLYHDLENIGVTADVAALKSDWSRYKVVILPAAIVMSREEQEKVKRFVELGGTVIATFLTSVKNRDNVGYTTSLPAGLTEVFGSIVEEVEPVMEGNHTKLMMRTESYEALCHMDETEDNLMVTTDGLWSELLGGVSETLGSYTEDYKEGAKVVSAFTYGKGRAYYVGTDLEPEAYRAFLKGVMKEAGVHRSVVEREPDVELVTRMDEEQEYLFLFNFTARETEVKLPPDCRDYLTGKPLDEKCRIERNGMLIAARSKTAERKAW